MPPRKGKKGKKGDFSDSDGDIPDPLAQFKVGKKLSKAHESSDESTEIKASNSKLNPANKKGKKAKNERETDKKITSTDSKKDAVLNIDEVEQISIKQENKERRAEPPPKNQKQKGKKGSKGNQIKEGSDENDNVDLMPPPSELKKHSDDVDPEYSSRNKGNEADKRVQRRSSKKKEQRFKLDGSDEDGYGSDKNATEFQNENNQDSENVATTTSKKKNKEILDLLPEPSKKEKKSRKNISNTRDVQSEVQENEGECLQKNMGEKQISNDLDIDEVKQKVEFNENENFLEEKNSSIKKKINDESHNKTDLQEKKSSKRKGKKKNSTTEEAFLVDHYDENISAHSSVDHLGDLEKDKGGKASKENVTKKIDESLDHDIANLSIKHETISNISINSEAEKKNEKEQSKSKKSKLELRLEEVARVKAEAEARVGLTTDFDITTHGAEEEFEAKNLKEKEDEIKRKEKEERREKKRLEKEMLEAMEEEYFGSDHEQRNMGHEESKEEEISRRIEESEKKTGKKLSARNRKKIAAEVESKSKDKISEIKESEAHRIGSQFVCSQTAVNEMDPSWQNALDIIIESFNVSAKDKTLFKNSYLQIIHGRKYGLVGPNGAGKSTLLKMISSKALKIPPRIDCLYVEQEVIADETPAVQAVMKADKERWDLLQEEKKLERALLRKPDDDDLNDRLLIVHEKLAELGADTAESKARRILHGLGFDEDMQVKPTKHFSGGWRMRISLARALFMEPTLLMLDEPTNHLDLNAVIWLDDYLQNWKKTLLVVSHDQDFLNSVCEEILHLESQKIQPYKGNYDAFKEMEAVRLAEAIKEWEKQQRKLQALKRAGSSKTKAEDILKKSKSREPGAGKKKKNDAIASGQSAQEEVSLAKRPREYAVTLKFAPVSQLSPPIIEVREVMFRYSPSNPIIFSNVDFGIDMDSRVCIVGPNGAGKTTLLKLLTGDLDPTEGDIRRNPRLRAGIYNQHFVDRLPMDIDPVSYLRSKFPDSTDYQSARNLLGKFGLEGHAHTLKMRDLSGGQKARVVFCDLQLLAPHILFLDEPTNNLDIESIDALCLAIKNFEGGVVVVTHDARLIESTDCRLWIVEKGSVTIWHEDFTSYKKNLLKELEEKMLEQDRRREELMASRRALKK